MPLEQRRDFYPMYKVPGQTKTSIIHQKGDDRLKEDSSKLTGGNRLAASMIYAGIADDFYSSGKHYMALKRYNQAWLLDDRNYQPYWGFAMVMDRRNQVDDVITYLEMALELMDDPDHKAYRIGKAKEFIENVDNLKHWKEKGMSQESADMMLAEADGSKKRTNLLADFGVVYYKKAKSLEKEFPKDAPEYFELAGNSFKDAAASDPNNGKVFRKWTFFLYDIGEYDEAWEKVELARSLGAYPFPEGFIKRLQLCMKEPEGCRKKT